MHLSNLLLLNMFHEMQKAFKDFCIEVHIALMIHAPSPSPGASPFALLCALRLLKLSSDFKATQTFLNSGPSSIVGFAGLALAGFLVTKPSTTVYRSDCSTFERVI